MTDKDPDIDRDDESREELIGKVLDHRYRIISVLGEGGVGVVYRAEHIKLGREVAVKVLMREYADKMQLRLRFEREARAMAALTHPNIVQVTDFGVWSGLPFLVMELIEGPTLKELIASGPLRPDTVVSLSRQILKAAAFAHGQGLVHRDLKPSNIILRNQPDGSMSISILDFGFAKFMTDDKERVGPQLTSTGMVFGTPAYMAPEQAAGQPADDKADLYSIGLMIFEMIAGQKPFEGDMTELLRHHLLSPPPLLSKTCTHINVPTVVDEFFQRALAKKSSDRFQSAEEMLATLEPLLVAGASSRPEHPTSPAESAKTILASSEELEAVDLDGSEYPGARRPSAVLERLSNLPASLSSKNALMITLIIAGVLLLAVFIVPMTVCLVCSADEDTSQEDSTGGAAGHEASGDETPREEGDRTPGGDEAARPAEDVGYGPWDDPNEPDFLTEAHNALDAGQRLNDRQVRQLRSYAMSNRDDPRPLLLLARYRLSRGNLTDAIDRYERAYNADPLSRRDPQMLTDLVTLSKSRSVGRRAGLAIKRIYGAQALDHIDRALAEPNLRSDDERRLRQLRDELSQ